MEPAVPRHVVETLWPRLLAEGVVTTTDFADGPAEAATLADNAGMATVLRRDGTVWVASSGMLPAPLGSRMAMAQVVDASRRWPELQPALPVRPRASVECDICEGRGLTALRGGSKEAYCLRCDGLGWLDASGEPRSAFEPPPLPSFETMRALIEHDEATPLDWTDLDDALWRMLSERLHSPETARECPEPVAFYYASRCIQWQVGNGGFAQAAHNIPEWFELAERGYRALGKDQAALLIAEARAMLPDERETLHRRGLLKATIGKVFRHFEQSRMARLDARVPACDWECDQDRVAYVRRHRDAFKQLA
jgi:hypothetical protein